VLIGPDPGGDVVDRLDDVLRPVVADQTVRPLRGVAANRHRRVDQQIEPVDRLFDPRAALGPDGAVVFAACQDLLYRIGRSRQSASRRRGGEVRRLVREEIGAAALGQDVAGAGIGAAVFRQSLCVTGRRQDPVEIDLGLGGDQVAGAVFADLQPVDLLKAARTVREKALPRLPLGRIGERAFLFPGRAVRLGCHVRQRVEAVLGTQFDRVDRLVGGALPLLVHMSAGIDVTIRWAVELGGVGFERMCAELLDIDGDRCCQALRAQHIETRRRTVRVREQGQPVLRSRLVGGDEWRGVLNCGIGSRQMSDPSFPCHAVRPLRLYCADRIPLDQGNLQRKTLFGGLIPVDHSPIGD
jgi:hypothetical protein